MKRATKIFLSAIVLTLAMLQPRTASAQKIDTLEVSTLYTTYIRFPKELLTAERSDSKNIIGEIVQESKNIVRLRATKPFTRMSNLTVIDSKGYLYTCYIKYCENPATTYYDKSSAAPAIDEQSKTNVESGAIMWKKYPDVPFPKETNDEDMFQYLRISRKSMDNTAFRSNHNGFVKTLKI